MPKKTTDWTSLETWRRLMVAVVASGVKVDYHTVADQFGTTYDSIEGQFRKIKREAIVMKAETAKRVNGDEAEAPAPKKAAAQKKKTAMDVVKDGRIAKATKKQLGKPAIKKEVGTDDEAFEHSMLTGVAAMASDDEI